MALHLSDLAFFDISTDFFSHSFKCPGSLVFSLVLMSRYPGGWINVRSVHIRCDNISLPLYITDRKTSEVNVEIVIIKYMHLLF